MPPPVPEQVTPEAPTLVEPTCDAPGDVIINPVDGVVYNETLHDDGSITITATAATGYVLTDGATTTWTYTQEQLAQLPDDHEMCATPPILEDATPVAPTLVEPTCDAPGDVIINPVDGVVYNETLHDDGSITITATAATGYVLTDGATTTWTYTQEQLAQLPDDHEMCVASLPPTVIQPDAPTAVQPTAVQPTATAPTVTEPAVIAPTVTEPAVVETPTAGTAESAAVPAAPTTLPSTGSETSSDAGRTPRCRRGTSGRRPSADPGEHPDKPSPSDEFPRGRVARKLIARGWVRTVGAQERSSLPVALRGSSSTKFTSRGTLWRARREATNDRTPSASIDPPGRRTTNAANR